MNTYCGANCEECPSKAACRGCVETGDSPFGGRCVAAEYIKAVGLEAYQQFKQKLLNEVNALLLAEGLGRRGVSWSWWADMSTCHMPCPAASG